MTASPEASPESRRDQVTPAGLRALDHVGIVVRSTDEATAYFSGRLGFPVVFEESFEQPPVRLTYVDCGNAVLQLIEPVGESPISAYLEAKGEGVHHVCFSCDDLLATASRLADAGAPEPVLGRGRGLRSTFVPGPAHHGVLIECNEFTAS